MIIHIIRIYHDDMAHCGIKKTIQGIASNYWFSFMHKKVQNYVNNCITCLVANASINSRKSEMQIISEDLQRISLPFLLRSCILIILDFLKKPRMVLNTSS